MQSGRLKIRRAKEQQYLNFKNNRMMKQRHFVKHLTTTEAPYANVDRPQYSTIFEMYEVAHTRDRTWVVLVQHFLPELQRLPVHRLGLCGFDLPVKRYGEAVHALERVWVFVPEYGLLQL
jgi:hypothetical protein